MESGQWADENRDCSSVFICPLHTFHCTLLRYFAFGAGAGSGFFGSVAFTSGFLGSVALGSAGFLSLSSGFFSSSEEGLGDGSDGAGGGPEGATDDPGVGGGGVGSESACDLGSDGVGVVFSIVLMFLC